MDNRLLLIFFLTLVAAIFCLPQVFSSPRAIRPFSVALKVIGVAGMGLGIYSAGNNLASPSMHLAGLAFAFSCWILAGHIQSKGRGKPQSHE